MTTITRTQSLEAFSRAQRVIPGGVNSPARAFGGVGGSPIFIQRAEGPYIYDIDGNRYLDFIGSWGPMILGHVHPEVVPATVEAVQGGSSYGAPCERETELATMVIDAIPSVEKVRFVSSGTEAAMSVVRLARGFTGRDKVIKFAGCYHGHVDSLLVAAGSSATTLGIPSSPGIPIGCTNDTIVLNYNSVTQLAETFKTHGDAIAGVILEPVAGNMGLVPPSEEFRRELRRLTHRHGVLLIYDEVMTGFRLAYGGAQELLGDSPDLTVLGKIIGGGYPVGAYGGRADIMGKVMPSGPVFQAGTLSGNPVAMAAGIATLKVLKRDNPYPRLNALAAKIEEGLCGSMRTFNRTGNMWTLFFTQKPVTDYDSAKTSDVMAFSRFFWAMMDRGYYLPCSQFEAAFLMTVMTDTMIDGFIRAANSVLA